MFKQAHLDIITIGSTSQDTQQFLVDNCDGLLLTGGFDIDPIYYQEKIHPKTKLEALEFSLIKMFTQQNKPILGICRGIQTINVAFGGTLIQDLESDFHMQKEMTGYQHLVKTTNNSLLKKYLGVEFHHQAINHLAKDFMISAKSEDNIIEGIEKDNIIGVQWHPEKNNDKIQQRLLNLFKDLLEEK
jgi:putative glutamine amidotransferase